MTSNTTRRAALGALASVPALAILPVAGAEPTEAPPVTAEQMAAMTFEPWEPIADGWVPPTNPEWMPFGEWALPTIRIAWVAMFKTKAELEKLSRDLSDETFEQMINGIGRAREAFEQFVEVLTSAETRIMCAAASALAKDDPEEFAKA
jgi:hypothetical protein